MQRRWVASAPASNPEACEPRRQVNRKRQAEAEQARAEAEATRREAQGKHPLVMDLAERNATISEELAQAAAQMNALSEQAGQTDKLARRIETQFKSARRCGPSPIRRRNPPSTPCSP